MRINLTNAEIHICDVLGTMRRRSAENRVVDQQMGKQATFNIDIDGMLGEYAVAKALNLCPDLTVGPRKGGSDLKTHSNTTIDVKTTRVKNGSLLATLKKKDSPSDVYVLAIVDSQGCNIVGWAYHHELMQEKNIKDKGHGPGYCLEQHQLHEDIYEIN